jgi:hypothetical protein
MAMSVRAKLKPRRRDVSSYRYFYPHRGYHRAPTTQSAVNAAASRVSVAPQNPRPVETKTAIRLDGDSVAHFWALETETAISYETLTIHWRAFADALTNAWTRG